MYENGFELDPKRFGYQNENWQDASISIVLEEGTFGKTFLKTNITNLFNKTLLNW